jgi:hypothetical protein
MPNAWVEHVRRFSKENRLTYGCALSTAECKASYQSSKIPKARAEPPKDKAYTDLLTMAQQAKQMKRRIFDKILDKTTPQERAESDSLILELVRKEMERQAEPITVIKRRSKQMVQVPIYFIKSTFKKKSDLNKAVKRAEKESEKALEYLSSFPDKSRHHFKQLIFGVITNFEEIHRIENELTEPDMSPSMITSRQARLKQTENELKDKLEELAFKGFVPMFL